MISRWCAAPEPEIWRICEDLDTGVWEEFPVDQHVRCKSEISKYHDGHEDCCQDDEEKEARACTCQCHSPLV